MFILVEKRVIRFKVNLSILNAANGFGSFVESIARGHD
jgi:hypothetical protein